MISKKFFKSSLTFSLVGALPMLSGFILLPFYTGDILSEKNYGYLTLHLAFSLLFQSIFVFCLDHYIGPIIIESKHDEKQLKKRMSAINYYSLLFSIIFIAILFIAGPFIFNSYFENDAPMQFYPFMYFTVITSFFNAYFKLYCNYLIYTEQPNRYLTVNIINFILTIGISISALHLFGDSIMGPLTGRLISGVVIFILAFIYIYKKYGIKSDSEFLKEIIKFCLPLLIFLILFWVFNNGDRFFIEKMLSTELVGLFDFGIKCTLGIEVFFSGLNNSIYPKIYTLIKEKASKEKIKEVVNKYASGYLVVIVIAIIITLTTVPFAVTLFIKKTFYHKALAFLAILTLGQIFKVLYYIYLAPLLYHKRTDLIAKSFVFATSIQLLITYLLIYFLGFNGIIIAYLVTKPFQILFVYFESNKFMQIPINITKQIILPLTLCAVILSLQLIVKNNQAIIYNPLIAFLILIITTFFYRKEIRPFYQTIISKFKN